MSQLSGVSQIAVEQGLLPGNPVRSLRQVRAAPTKEVDPLSPAELERLIMSASRRDRVIYALAGHLDLGPKDVRLS